MTPASPTLESRPIASAGEVERWRSIAARPADKRRSETDVAEPSGGRRPEEWLTDDAGDRSAPAAESFEPDVWLTETEREAVGRSVKAVIAPGDPVASTDPEGDAEGGAEGGAEQGSNEGAEGGRVMAEEAIAEVEVAEAARKPGTSAVEISKIVEDVLDWRENRVGEMCRRVSGRFDRWVEEISEREPQQTALAESRLQSSPPGSPAAQVETAPESRIVETASETRIVETAPETRIVEDDAEGGFEDDAEGGAGSEAGGEVGGDFDAVEARRGRFARARRFRLPRRG